MSSPRTWFFSAGTLTSVPICRCVCVTFRKTKLYRFGVEYLRVSAWSSPKAARCGVGGVSRHDERVFDTKPLTITSCLGTGGIGPLYARRGLGRGRVTFWSLTLSPASFMSRSRSVTSPCRSPRCLNTGECRHSDISCPATSLFSVYRQQALLMSPSSPFYTF